LCCGDVGEEGFSWLAAAPAVLSAPAVVGAPAAFDMTMPADGSTSLLLTGSSQAFQWNDTTGEEDYTFELADDVAFATILDTQTLPAESAGATVPGTMLVEMHTYYWRVRANNSSGSTTATNAPFSFQVDFVPPGGPGPGLGPLGTNNDSVHCFVATAAYGSPMADEVQTLRSFRDRVLLQNTAGCVFVGLYYRHGPALAAVIADHPARRGAARLALWPLVGVAHTSLWALDHPIAALAFAACLVALLRAWILHRARRPGRVARASG
jgi:hypothetical protein